MSSNLTTSAVLKTITTEVEYLGLWNFSYESEVDIHSSIDKERKLAEIMNRGDAVAWGTGSEGTFRLEVRTSDFPLTDEENGILLDEVRNLKFIVKEDKVCFGSIEWIGQVQTNKESVGILEGLSPGTYSVSLFHLSTDESNGQDLNDDEEEENEVNYVVILEKVEKDHDFSKVVGPKTLV